METRTNRMWIGMMVLLLGLSGATRAEDLGTVFSYQGRLETAGSPPTNGTYDFRFTLHADPNMTNPNQLGNTVDCNDVVVTEGIFSVEIDPAAGDSTIFNGEVRYLEIAVRKTGSAESYFTISPRQRIHAAPYAITALRYAGFGLVPLGTIMAWHKDLPGTPPLPDGWVECNGQQLDDPDSPYFGQNIPDLNGSNRFLKGSGTSGKTEDSYLGKHRHPVGYTWYSGNYGRLALYDSLGNAETVLSHVYSNQIPSGSGKDDDYVQFGTNGHNYYTHQNTYLAEPDNTRAVRPKNMTIVWIMRVK